MNWHPTEDELILHYYGEAPNEIRSVTEAHLADCSSCAAAWRELNSSPRRGDGRPRAGAGRELRARDVGAHQP